ncbi:unnamed protein product [Trichobilharzia regenti]|nr:unnamed protein product [Trichobilharzia regenti]
MKEEIDVEENNGNLDGDPVDDNVALVTSSGAIGLCVIKYLGQ